MKILTLGVGGCGKTTFIKQMKIIHGIQWDTIELDNYVKIIRANLVAGTQDAIEVARKAKIKLNSDNNDNIEFVNDLRPRAVELTDTNVQKLKAVFNDPGIQEVLKSHGEDLSITASNLIYFFDNMDLIVADDYCPKDEDILRCRQRTAGANFSTIYLGKKYFEFHDVGGQRPERAKWEQIIKDHTFGAVLYFIACDEYDLHSAEGMDTDRTKMDISRHIFGEIVNSTLIDKNTPIVLFLNRIDLFKLRIADKNGWKAFKKVYPTYDGDKDLNSCLEHIGDNFLKTLKEDQKDRVINTHQTCALDTDLMKVVWDSVREGILRVALAKVGYS